MFNLFKHLFAKEYQNAYFWAINLNLKIKIYSLCQLTRLY